MQQLGTPGGHCNKFVHDGSIKHLFQNCVIVMTLVAPPHSRP
jgi:hypothetical protein